MEKTLTEMGQIEKLFFALDLTLWEKIQEYSIFVSSGFLTRGEQADFHLEAISVRKINLSRWPGTGA